MNLAGQPASAKVTAGNREQGYAMAALLVGISVMSVLMSMALPVWSHMAKREKEEELIWRGKQYVRAITLFQRKFANTYPPTVDVLVDQRFLRKKYKDPITNEDFVLLPAGAGMPMQNQIPGQTGPGGPTPPMPSATGGTPTRPTISGPTQAVTPGGNIGLGIGGVASRSKETSIKIYNGRQKYNEWAFVAIQAAQRIGAPNGGQFPGQPIQPGMPGMPGMPPGRGPGTTFNPAGRGGMPPNMPSGRPPVPFGQPGQSPFGQSPFGGRGQQPQRPPGG